MGMFCDVTRGGGWVGLLHGYHVPKCCENRGAYTLPKIWENSVHIISSSVFVKIVTVELSIELRNVEKVFIFLILIHPSQSLIHRG